jgi:hypothetical protein
MSATGTAPTLIQTIKNDLASFGGWLETEAESFAATAWTDFKALFASLTAQQYTILKSLVAEVQADENAGDGVEATVADVLTLASQKELAWVASLPASALTAATALASQELAALAPSVASAPAPAA